MSSVADTVVDSGDNGAAKAKGGPSKFRTVCAFLRNGACSKTLMTVLDRELGHPMRPEERASDPLAGGLMQGYQCGMLWGSTLAAGAEAHRRNGAGPRAEASAVRAAERLVEAFRAQNDEINCLEITETDPRNMWQVFKYFLLKGGTVGCMRRAARYAPEAKRAIDAALSEDHDEASCQPVSCAAMLAKRLGASDLHATMAAGFAGGIGMSGGACGALGAAIWILGMQGREEGASGKAINDRIGETIDRFLRSSGFELECADIVGRRFEGTGDHAAYLQQGGCAELLEALAAAVEEVTEPTPAPAHEEAAAA